MREDVASIVAAVLRNGKDSSNHGDNTSKCPKDGSSLDRPCVRQPRMQPQDIIGLEALTSSKGTIDCLAQTLRYREL